MEENVFKIVRVHKTNIKEDGTTKEYEYLELTLIRNNGKELRFSKPIFLNPVEIDYLDLCDINVSKWL